MEIQQSLRDLKEGQDDISARVADVEKELEDSKKADDGKSKFSLGDTVRGTIVGSSVAATQGRPTPPRQGSSSTYNTNVPIAQQSSRSFHYRWNNWGCFPGK